MQRKQQPGFTHLHRTGRSTTWTRLHPNMYHHDLTHYVVESTIDLQNSFLGKVASGIDINEFNKPKNERGFEIPAESIQTEYIIGLLQVELADGVIFENFTE